MGTQPTFGEDEHARFIERGYVRLGKVLTDDALEALRQRIDDIMLGRVRYPHMRFQLDPQAGGDKGMRRMSSHEVATLAYRRIDDLEQDPLFLAHMQRPLFGQIARRYIGEEVAVFRSMFMNKPAGLGTELGWHQDVGAGWQIDRNPFVTVWTALDAATTASGCMQIVPGSNRHGVINERHFVSDEEIGRYAGPGDIVDLEAEAGETVLLHNFLLHRSGVNHTGAPRRAFSCTYMEAETRSLVTGETFPRIFGRGAPDPADVPEKTAAAVEVFHG